MLPLRSKSVNLQSVDSSSLGAAVTWTRNNNSFKLLVKHIQLKNTQHSAQKSAFSSQNN